MKGAQMTEAHLDTQALVHQLVDALTLAHKREIPLNVDLWDVATVAKYLKRDPDGVRDRICTLPDFPQAIRLPSTGSNARKGHPLWKAAEVIKWAEGYQEKRRK